MKVTDLLRVVADTRTTRLIVALIVVVGASVMAEAVAVDFRAARLAGALLAVGGAAVALGSMWALLRLPPAQRWILTGKWSKIG
jgi:hypothetical protein